MKQKKTKKKPASGKAGSKAAAISHAADGRRPLVPALVWVGIMGLSLLLTGCPSFGLFYAIYLFATLVIMASELAFLNAIYRKGRTNLFFGWKKFTGYSLPVYYVVHSLPRVEWRNAELIGEGRNTFLIILTLLATLAGCAVFFLAGRPKTHAGLDLITREELTDKALRKKRAREKKPKGVLFGILDWVDAIAWAAIAVILVNIFIFQLYAVPSESMVPTFLVNDRPFTLKIASGPRIPLTDWRLPFLRLPRRGDVVTIANPRYPENHKVDPRKYLSQFVYMITFTGVNLDTLPDGTPKADPLVKRVVGVPGEKLMMVDDVLYARTKGQAGFHKVQEPWAAVDLWKTPAQLRSQIKYLPMNEETRAALTKWDARKNEADLGALSRDIASAYSGIEARLSRLSPSKLSALADQALARGDPSLRTLRDKAVESALRGENPFASQGASAEDLSLLLATLGSPEARLALDAYVQGALEAAVAPAANAYERGSRALNLMIKVNLLNRMDRDLDLLTRGEPMEALGADARRTLLAVEARELYIYLQGFYDARNFPEFPSGDAFLASDEYFAMGDNRYNSLDFRFSETSRTRALDSKDPVSVLYSSILNPFPLKLRFIEGHAIFRVWPTSRLGTIH